IGQAMFVYASGNSGDFPDTLDKVLPFAAAGVFVCPSTSHTPARGSTPQAEATNLYAGGHLSYVYVAAGLNTNRASLNAPTTLLLYEPLANHADGVNVLYADGSVVFLARPAALTMIAGLRPAAMQPATSPSSAGPGGK